MNQKVRAEAIEIERAPVKRLKMGCSKYFARSHAFRTVTVPFSFVASA
jgi:hypothetical protein